MLVDMLLVDTDKDTVSVSRSFVHAFTRPFVRSACSMQLQANFSNFKGDHEADCECYVIASHPSLDVVHSLLVQKLLALVSRHLLPMTSTAPKRFRLGRKKYGYVFHLVKEGLYKCEIGSDDRANKKGDRMWLVYQAASRKWITFDGPDGDSLDMSQLQDGPVMSSTEDILAAGPHVWTLHMLKGKDFGTQWITFELPPESESELTDARSRPRSPGHD